MPPTTKDDLKVTELTDITQDIDEVEIEVDLDNITEANNLTDKCNNDRSILFSGQLT